MATMKAVRIHGFGGPETLVYEDAPRPEPGAGEVLVRLIAAGVNPIDWKVRSGAFQKQMPPSFPIILGWDVAGTIEAIGDGVTDLKSGDAVFGMIGLPAMGAYAEYVTMKADSLAPKPQSLDWTQTAAVPMAALTSWQALFEQGGLTSGQTVLIQGASGGLGTFGTQFAKAMGARVIGTAGGDGVELVKSLGADEVINYETTRFEDIVKDVDLVADFVGGETAARSLSVIKSGGVLATTLPPGPDPNAAKERNVTIKVINAHPSAAQLKEVAGLIDSGKVKVIVQATFPLEQARQAHEQGEKGHSRGKTVLTIVA